MKKIITGILAILLGLLCVWLWQFRGCVTTPDGAGELYDCFKDCKDVKVEFFRDYHIDNDLTCDVTIISTDDSCTWNKILEKAGIKEEVREKYWNDKKRGIKLFSAILNRESEDGSIKDINLKYGDFFIFNSSDTKLFVFTIRDEEHFDKIYDYALIKSMTE